MNSMLRSGLLINAFALILMLFSAKSTLATVTPAGVFSDSMVLQRGMNVPIWGWAAIGEVVTVAFNGQTLTTTARDSTLGAYKGYWKVKLASMNAGGPYDLTITGSATPAITLKNVLVGDVWFCSGQSNMRYSFSGLYLNDNSPEVQTLPPDGSPITRVRMCKIGPNWSSNPALDIQQTNQWGDIDNRITAPWRSCSKAAGMEFSATALVFGLNVYRKVNVPIGLISASVGQTSLKDWVGAELSDTIAWRTCGGKPDTVVAQRTPLRFGGGGNSAGALFGGMVSPVMGMAIKGVLWWQGENEGSQYSPVCYFTSGGFIKQIREWRRKWGQGDFPFICIQLQQMLDDHSTQVNDVRDQQMQALAEPNMGLAVCFDSSYMIHPPNRYVVAQRAAITARALAYGENIESMGPIYNSMAIEGSTIRIRFAHVANGLKKMPLVWFEGDNNLAVGANTLSSANDAAAPFEIAGADNVYHRADAVISGNTVVVSASSVTTPKNVRYGIEFPARAKTPLYNSDNLPASMFRTSTWGGLNTPTILDRRSMSSGPGALADTRAFKVFGGKIMLPEGSISHARNVAIYNVKGSLIGKLAVDRDGTVRINRRMSGEQLVVVRVR